MTFLVAIPCILINILSNNQNEWKTHGEEVSFISLFSIGNIGKNSENYSGIQVDITIILNTIMIFIIYISSLILK